MLLTGGTSGMRTRAVGGVDMGQVSGSGMRMNTLLDTLVVILGMMSGLPALVIGIGTGIEITAEIIEQCTETLLKAPSQDMIQAPSQDMMQLFDDSVLSLSTEYTGLSA